MSFSCPTKVGILYDHIFTNAGSLFSYSGNKVHPRKCKVGITTSPFVQGVDRLFIFSDRGCPLRSRPQGTKNQINYSYTTPTRF